MRVVLADDSALLREGLRRILEDADIQVVAAVSDGDQLAAAVRTNERIDLAIVDIRMPPSFTTEGAVVAAELRRSFPDLGLLLLSQTIESSHALRLAAEHPRSFGYLLKDRVIDVNQFLEAIANVTRGGTVLDPAVVAAFLRRRTSQDRLSELTERERDVLSLMAEGKSNLGIATVLFLAEKTVETHVARIFSKLGLPAEAEDHRRVLAVRAWLLAGN